MLQVPSVCPVCGGDLHVEVVRCNKCDTTLQNKFGFSVFEKLSVEQTAFVLSFIKCEGSIKEMEKELKVSYPTVKARLTEIKKVLNLENGEPKLSNIEILNRLKRGELSADGAAELIRKNSGK